MSLKARVDVVADIDVDFVSVLVVEDVITVVAGAVVVLVVVAVGVVAVTAGAIVVPVVIDVVVCVTFASLGAVVIAAVAVVSAIEPSAVVVGIKKADVDVARVEDSDSALSKVLLLLYGDSVPSDCAS
jgi:hypothetical protein